MVHFRALDTPYVSRVRHSPHCFGSGVLGEDDRAVPELPGRPVSGNTTPIFSASEVAERRVIGLRISGRALCEARRSSTALLRQSRRRSPTASSNDGEGRESLASARRWSTKRRTPRESGWTASQCGLRLVLT
ncbi:unnamed protein product [Ixodes persulcatus]